MPLVPPRRFRRSAAATLALIGVLLTGGGGWGSVGAAGSESPAPSPGAADSQRRATTLDRLATVREESTADARARLAALADASGTLLETFVTARATAQTARAEQRRQQARLEAARVVVRSERATLGRYAASAYRNGGAAGQFAVIISLLETRSPTDVGRAAADLQWAGTQQSNTVSRVESAAATVADAAAAAAAARSRAEVAETAAREAKTKAAALVTQQKVLVAALARRAAAARGAADVAAATARQLARARVVADQRGVAAAAARAAALSRGEVVLSAGACTGRDTSGYPNGQIPLEALCPLWGAEWQVARADAADAFGAMSKAYAAEFGRPICVTDSYRNLPMQVDLHARKPGMTAVPGTSNHGWGTAVDLCDGVERFGTPTFTWLQVNAPRFGWFHPSWAVAGGTRPEPWHWEFAG